MQDLNKMNSCFNKNFNLIVLGQIISILGSSLLRFGLSTYILDTTGRADIFAALYAISNIPLLFSPIGGAIADRFNRKNLMVIFDFMSSIIIFTFICLLSSLNNSIILIGVIMVLLSIISSMYQPTVQASIPLIVNEKDLEQANGIVNGIGSLSSMFAPVLGGLLYGLIGIKMLLITSCIAFFLSAVMEMFIHIPFNKREVNGSIVSTIVSDMKEGFSYVIKQSYISKAMILAASLNLFLTPFLLVGIQYILRITMHSSNNMYGIGIGIIEFSSVLGALSIGMFAKKMKMNTLYRWLMLISILMIPMAISVSPSMLKLGYYPSFILLFICVIPIAMSMTIITIFVLTIVQKQTPNELLGKVMATITAVSQCVAPVGQIMHGKLFEVFSSRVYIPIVCMFIIMLSISILAKYLYKNESKA
ncbi:MULTISPECIES: MFS transporter [unclassified Clostridioides]|uniref:MFS transporter n=1 Tax=unclassified Clostridioides TaxID=2635829 RepID=UPI001D10CEEA|nr:MFS transporter [Clostridioides sp. ZZV14-6150]MCC0658664.1 MFS transporter [Clostridioides sp. ZZV14-6154]MCC0668874.1 MFS transporter [Clostridioides sp. ZZV14-6153]MCC0719760.1 MFS transporter [Clostridioides sp. ZZV14-6105]MCC0725157.1 MFS transporter [Clostridioides sp. ZZV14-6045]MCC0731907.1 MFS transporter [Clostridioides sp. ZZV14-6048]MCC0733530.1 MFS transporter [Clostridioides sp. ZZV14-6009]MCC0736951.1 MFS transporter [Clostridioides sp. ZZV14-5902]MCC0741881.1 MFS transpor